jgi:hypothetical protein
VGARAATQQSHSMPTTTGRAHDGALPAVSVPSVAVPVEGDGGVADPVRSPHAGAAVGASHGGPSLVGASHGGSSLVGASHGGPSLVGASHSGSLLPRARHASTIVPLRKGRYKVEFTASQSLVDMFNEARDLFQNQLPTGDLPSILERALALLIAERKKQRFAQTTKPRVPRLSGSETAAPRSAPSADKLGSATRLVRSEPQPSKSNSQHIAHASETPADKASRPITTSIRAEPELSKPNAPRSAARLNLGVVQGAVSEARPPTLHRPPRHERARNGSARNHAAARKGRPTAIPNQASRRPHRTQTQAHPLSSPPSSQPHEALGRINAPRQSLRGPLHASTPPVDGGSASQACGVKSLALQH